MQNYEKNPLLVVQQLNFAVVGALHALANILMKNMESLLACISVFFILTILDFLVPFESFSSGVELFIGVGV